MEKQPIRVGKEGGERGKSAFRAHVSMNKKCERDRKAKWRLVLVCQTRTSVSVEQESHADSAGRWQGDPAEAHDIHHVDRHVGKSTWGEQLAPREQRRGEAAGDELERARRRTPPRGQHLECARGRRRRGDWLGRVGDKKLQRRIVREMPLRSKYDRNYEEEENNKCIRS